jgi:hypothetical protein
MDRGTVRNMFHFQNEFEKLVSSSWFYYKETLICRMFFCCSVPPCRTSSVTHRIRVEVTNCGTSCHAAGPVGHARAVFIGCPWPLADLVAIGVCTCQFACVSLLKHTTLWQVEHCECTFPFSVPRFLKHHFMCV